MKKMRKQLSDLDRDIKFLEELVKEFPSYCDLLYSMRVKRVEITNTIGKKK